MWRHIVQTGVTLMICGLYSIILFTKEADKFNYLLISNLVGFFLVISFVAEIRMNKLIRKMHFKAFSLGHLTLIIKRISIFYKKFFLWKLMVLPPLMLLFIGGASTEYKVTITVLSITQNIFTVYLFISVYDLLEIKGFEKHINILPAALGISLIFIRNSKPPEWYFINPFGGIMNLPLLANPLFYMVPLLLFASLYYLNNYYTHKYWDE
ncbi:MAG: hypothetical protein ACFCUM_18485 [Bacteroidales bacterium]